jgi:hypothetical protein
MPFRPNLPYLKHQMKPTPTIDRRGWLATWLQKRRRGRQHKLLPAPVLVAQYPTQVVWTWDYANPYRWNAYLSLNNGVTWQFDDWKTGDARMYAPDGGSSLILIVGVDESGNEITERSNAVRPDDAPLPLQAPVLIDAGYAWNANTPPTVDMEISFSFDSGSYPPASLEIWESRDGGEFTLLFNVDSSAGYFLYPNACDSEIALDFKARYVNGSVQGPFSNVMRVEVQV